MESNPARRPGRALAVTVGVLAAVAVVAVAARGSLPAGEPGVSRPSDTLVDVFFTLYLLLLAAGAAFYIYLLALQKRMKREAGELSSRPVSLLVMGVILLVGVLGARRLRDFELRPVEPEEILPVPTGPIEPGTATTSPEPELIEPEFAWIPALAIAGLVVLAVAGVLWAEARRRRSLRPPGRVALGEALADVLAETLDDLRAERDPRRAVIAAYGRLERVLAANGLPRRPSDAPEEYLARILRTLEVSPEAARRLTALFERAKFSQHEVGPEMKDEAIEALQTVQEELRAADALAAEARRQAAAKTLERARGAG